MKPKVILDPHHNEVNKLFSPRDLERMNALADIIWARDERMPDEELAKFRDEAEIIISGWWRHGAVQDYPKLHAFIDVGGTFPSRQSLDYEHCFGRGIQILSCAPAFASSVAQMALALALASSRGVVETAEAFRSGNEVWGDAANSEAFLLSNQLVGMIGFGSLARALKPLLAPFGCPIQAYDPWLTKAFLQTQGVTPVGLEALLETSRVIFVLATPSASNQALLNREKLQLIRPDAVLVLISRAHLVDFEALTEMVLQGRFRAAIDVFPKEPLPPEHPIRGAKQAILSSHRAGGTAEAYRSIGRMVVNDLEAILNGLAPQELQRAQPEYIRKRG